MHPPFFFFLLLLTASTTTVENEHSCSFSRSVVVFQHHRVPPPSWGGFDPSPHLSRIRLTSPPATSIENEHVIACFQCWWAPHLTTPPHYSPPSKTSNDLLIFDAGGLCTSPCHLTTHQHRKQACRCSFSILVGSAPHYHLTTTHHHRK